MDFVFNENAEYKVTDKGVTLDEELIVPRETLEENKYTYGTDGLIGSENEDVSLDADFFSTFFPTDVSAVDPIVIDDIKYTLNDKGELVDETNAVFKTKEQYDAYLLEQEGTITITNDDGESVTLKLDDKGDAINDEGEVVYTANEISRFEEDDNTPVGLSVENLTKLTNIIINDETGKPVVYADGDEGVASYMRDVYNQGGLDQGGNAIKSLYSNMPEVETFIKYLSIHGSSDGYDKSKADYSKVTLDKDNKEQLKSLIIDAEIQRGKSKEAAERAASYVISDGKDFEEATEALKFLTDAQTSKENSRQADQVAQADASRKEFVSHWGTHFEKGKLVVDNVADSIYDKIMNKKAIKVGDKDYNLPPIIRREVEGKIVNVPIEQFYDYMFVAHPIKMDDGQVVHYTNNQLDEMMSTNAKTKDDEIFESFMRFTGGSTDQFVSRQIDKKEVNKKRTIRVKSFEGKNIKKKIKKSDGTGKIKPLFS